MKTRRLAPLVLAALMGSVFSAGLSLPAPAQAQDQQMQVPATPKKAKRHKARAPKQDRVLPGGETAKERERRLLRECRGRPNAGACLGYAS